ncbi:MAG: glycosyltransferase family 4 protein [Armatimonadetes bacterium]|nr:glycosyltransferase family 4 protein [Armatimonadota bacterium]
MHVGICCIDALGWKVVRKRWGTCLPSVFAQVTFANPEDYGNPYLRRGFRTFAKQLAMRRAVSAAVQEGADRVIIATNGEAGMLPTALASRCAIYGDASHRQVSSLYRWNRPEYKLRARDRSMKRLAANGARFVAMSRWASTGFETDYDCKPVVIPPPLDTALFGPGELRQANRVVFVGGDFERKGGPTLLQAAALVPDAEFHLVSHQTPVELPPNCLAYRQVGPESSELVSLLAGAGIFALPTSADCSPLAILEAQASGLPVISTHIGGIPDMVDSETGEMVPIGDAKALAEAIWSLISHPERASRLGAAGLKSVQERNALPVHAHAWARALADD